MMSTSAARTWLPIRTVSSRPVSMNGARVMPMTYPLPSRCIATIAFLCVQVSPGEEGKAKAHHQTQRPVLGLPTVGTPSGSSSIYNYTNDSFSPGIPSQTGGQDGSNSPTGGNGTSSTGGNSSGPSVGVVVGIAIGCTIGAVILGVLIFRLIRKPKPPQSGPYNPYTPPGSNKHDPILSSHELSSQPSRQPSSQPYIYMPQQQAYLSPQPVIIPRGRSPGSSSELPITPSAVSEFDSISQVAGLAAHSPETSLNHSRETTTQQRMDSFNTHMRVGSGSQRPGQRPRQMPADLMSNTGTEMTGGDGFETWSAPGYR